MMILVLPRCNENPVMMMMQADKGYGDAIVADDRANFPEIGRAHV